MSWQYVIYILSLSVAATVSVILAFFVWRRRPVSGAVSFVWLTLAVAVWSLGYALELGGAGLEFVDLTPFAFALSGAAVAWGLLRFRLFGIVPVARDAIVEGMGDGVIVADARGRLVDLNPVAQCIFGCCDVEAIGQPAIVRPETFRKPWLRSGP